MMVYVDGQYKEVTSQERNELMQFDCAYDSYGPDEFAITSDEIVRQFLEHYMSFIHDDPRIEFKEGYIRVQKFNPEEMRRYWVYEAIDNQSEVM